MGEFCYNCFRETAAYGPCPYCGYDPAPDAGRFPHALPHGTVLGGRFITGRVLGQGGFGITYIAQDHQTGGRAAIKEFFPDTMVSRGAANSAVPFTGQRGDDFTYGKAAFLSEAETLAQFNENPNIVHVYSYFEENGTAYFAMEYVEGASFQEYINRSGGRVSWADAERILFPVMDALAAVHARGLIHRDVKPDNIMIASDGSTAVKLLDFGSARYSLGEKSRSLDVVLTHGFSPKEQYSRHGRQGPYTDVYALAATFYYAVTGHKPPDSIDRMERDDLVMPTSLGAQLSLQQEDAILRGLAVQPEDRWQSIAEFRAALIGTGEAPAVSPQPYAYAATRPQQNYAAVSVPSATATPGFTSIPGYSSAPGFTSTPGYSQQGYAPNYAPAPQPAPRQANPMMKWLIPAVCAVVVVGAAVAALVMRGRSNAEDTRTVEIETVETERPRNETEAPVYTAPPAQTPAPAANIIASGLYGGSASWALYDNGLMQISGSGTIDAEAYDTWGDLCGRITSAEVGEGITALGYRAFDGCYNLQSLTLPDSLTEIGGWVFPDCTSLTSLTIPAGVTRIGDYTFDGCTALASIEVSPLNRSYRSADGVLFDGAGTLVCYPAGKSGASYTVPGGTAAIGEDAFAYCSALRSVTLPSGLREIREWAFDNCANLSGIAFPDSLTSIGYNAFHNCSSLKSVTIPAGADVDADAFPSTTAVSGGQAQGQAASEAAGGSCGDAVTWSLDEGGTLYISGSGPMGNYDYTARAPWYDYRETITAVRMFSGVTTVGEYAFHYCRNLTDVSLPDTVTALGDSCFDGCNSMTELTIPGSVTELDDFVFYNCTALAFIEIPGSVTRIGTGVFHGCTGLGTVVFNGEAPSISSSAFENVTANAYYSPLFSSWTNDKLKDYGGSLTWWAQGVSSATNW